jgi:hypothetical protein
MKQVDISLVLTDGDPVSFADVDMLRKLDPGQEYTVQAQVRMKDGTSWRQGNQDLDTE